MRTRHHVASTTENDSLLLPEGVLTIDEEKKAVRFHDGETVGGYEIMGIRAYDPPIPGPVDLVGGDMTSGFFGEVPVEDLFTGEELANTIGLSAGVSQFSDEPWLKFALDGRILFIAKKNIVTHRVGLIFIE